MSDHKYDIFISYRRVGGAQYARILQLMLIQRGYKVFLDYDELTDGVFSDKIRAALKEAPVFMLVLSGGSMQRCANEGDWVREEITLAVKQQKHIIPVNPDNSFDGFPGGMPEELKEAVGSHQHSEISFGQALGATIDLMIKNRLVPTLGERTSLDKKDEDYASAQETLRRQDAHNRFMKRLGITSAIIMIAIVLGTCFWFWKNQHDKDDAEAEIAALETMRSELQEKYKNFKDANGKVSNFMLQFSPDLTVQQMATIDTLLTNMTTVYPDSIWMSQFEFTIGQWYGIKGEPYDEAQAHMPMTNVSFADVSMFLMRLCDMTNLNIELPSVELWQYAAHGGEKHEMTRYVGSDEVEEVAWYKDNANGFPHPSDGQQGKEPNMLDLFDMSGNVSELCNSPFDDSGAYTICGGDYDSPATEVTATSRKGFATDAKDKHVGFRIIIRKP